MDYCEFIRDIVDKLKSVQGIKAIVLGGSWSAQFTLDVAKKSVRQGDVYFVAGSLTRIISCLVQVLYALNETYFISDKRMDRDAEKFLIKPQNFSGRVDGLLGVIGRNRKELGESLRVAEGLLDEVAALCNVI